MKLPINLIQEARLAALRKRDDYKPSGTPRLWGSDMGYCSRKSILRILGHEPTIPFTPEAELKMKDGLILEDATVADLQAVYGKEKVITQFTLSTELWSCKVDAVIVNGGATPILVEHKATGEKWWNYQGSLPNPHHIGQLWLYGELWNEIYGERPDLVLFYRAWNHYAHLELDPETLTVTGWMDGKPFTKAFDGPHVRESRDDLENCYTNKILPGKLKRKEDGCTFKGKPSCQMYYHCWKEEGNGPT